MNISNKDILVMLFEMQATMDAILNEMGRKAVILPLPPPEGDRKKDTPEGDKEIVPRRRGIKGVDFCGVKLVASRCSTCARLPANRGDYEVGYGVYPACGDWEYLHVIPAGVKRESRKDND